jgi:hypothetical protein
MDKESADKILIFIENNKEFNLKKKNLFWYNY